MTETEAKRKLCVYAESQVGTRESGNNWNKYAENADLHRLYGWNPQNQPWCDVFVDVAFISCFGFDNAAAMTYQPMGAGSALCRQSAQYYKDAGAWYRTPEIGDQVFFYTSGDINHTGIVIRVAGGSVVTVEGNSSDMVSERCYSVSDAKIAGYGRPKWSIVAGEDTNASAETKEQAEEEAARRFYVLRLPYLRRGDSGETVKAVQAALIGRGISCGRYGADGDYGGDTERAVRELQGSAGLPEDGVVGPETGAALFGGEVYTAPEDQKPEPKADSFWNNLLTKIRR